MTTTADTHFGLTRTVAPASEPLTASETRTWCRIDSDDASQDDVLTVLISDARERCERITSRSLITQTWRLAIDDWPAGVEAITLPRGAPLQSVTSVEYQETAGVYTTLSASDYVVDIASEPGRVLPAAGLTWNWGAVATPATAVVMVTYVAGYGLAAAVPKDIKRALLACVSHCYHNRERPDEGFLDRLFAGFRVGVYY